MTQQVALDSDDLRKQRISLCFSNEFGHFTAEFDDLWGLCVRSYAGDRLQFPIRMMLCSIRFGGYEKVSIDVG